jgi:predicted N-formylglutamate amidohydrolase
MPTTEDKVAQVGRFAGERLVVTCEHASNAVPKKLSPGLGVGGSVLRTHVAWDRGSRELASILAHRLGATQFMGRQTRLVVDLNRNRGSRQLIPTTSFGVAIPGNRKLTRQEREARIEKYWQPYRDAVERAVQRAIDEAGECIHFSVHTFVPKLDGKVRSAEVGILYDPRRPRERKFAEALRARLEEAFLDVRMNYPYKGASDGLTTFLRNRFPKSRYIGIELEVNQALLETSRQVWRMGRVLTEAIAEVVEV